MSLKDLREKAGLSQAELGRRLAAELQEDTEPKFYQPRISAYESGRNRMPLPIAVALAKVLTKAGRKKVAAEDLL